MNTAKQLSPPHILLIEPDNMVRGTLASVCRDLGLAQVTQATSVAAAGAKLSRRDLHGVFVALDDAGTAMNLLAKVRAGQFACNANLAMAVKASMCTAEMVKTLKELDVKRILLQPFKLRDAILSLEQLLATLVPEAQPISPAKPAVAEDAAAEGDVVAPEVEVAVGVAVAAASNDVDGDLPVPTGDSGAQANPS